MCTIALQPKRLLYLWQHATCLTHGAVMLQRRDALDMLVGACGRSCISRAGGQNYMVLTDESVFVLIHGANLPQRRNALDTLAGPVWMELLYHSRGIKSMWNLLEHLYGSGDRGFALGKLRSRGAPEISLEALQAELPRVLVRIVRVLPLQQLATAMACLLRARRSSTVWHACRCTPLCHACGQTP